MADRTAPHGEYIDRAVHGPGDKHWPPQDQPSQEEVASAPLPVVEDRQIRNRQNSIDCKKEAKVEEKALKQMEGTPNWLKQIPVELRNSLLWDRSNTVPIPQRAIVLLYTGEKDVWKEGEWWPALDEQIECVADGDGQTTGKVIPIEMLRCKRTNNMLKPEPYNSLCTAATDGRIQQLGGGPNCRTWSIKLHVWKPYGGRPCRGRGKDEWLGLPELKERGREVEIEGAAGLTVDEWSSRSKEAGDEG